jgi:hypothetical protein
MNEAFLRALDRVIAVASKHERELLAYPGVVSVGAGPQRKGGRITGQPAIIVTVRRKTDAPEQPLPREIDGVPVDINELGKPVEAPEIIAAQARAREVLEKYREQWLRVPNVTGIGIGYKTVKGEFDVNRIALKVFVDRKLRGAELERAATTPVPPEIDGVLTDVEEMAPQRPVGASGSRADRKDPLVGGCAVGVQTRLFSYGTFGAIVFDRSTGEQLVLGNQHVLDAGVGTEVIQPSPVGLDDSFEFGFQLDVCNPIHFFRLDTPNTTVGTVLASAAAGALLAAALSDEIDPTRRGQEATVPPPAAKTLLEHQQVFLKYPELPIPGTHFKIDTAWKYTRHTTAGDFTFDAKETKQNPHALADKLLLTDRKLYHPGETVRLYALVLPEPCAPKKPNPQPVGGDEIQQLAAFRSLAPATLSDGVRQRAFTTDAVAEPKRCRCERFHVTAILTPVKVDRAFPVVLREPVAARKTEVLVTLAQMVHSIEDEKLRNRIFVLLRYGCTYTGELTATEVPTGPWKHYLFVQTVNTATEDMKPEQAAQIIGGLPVSQNTVPQLDVACGPFIIEDGQFDIEPMFP